LGLTVGELVNYISTFEADSWQDLELLLPVCRRVPPAVDAVGLPLGSFAWLNEAVDVISSHCRGGAETIGTIAPEFFLLQTRTLILALGAMLSGHLFLKCTGEPKPWLIVDTTKREIVFLDVRLPFHTLENRLLELFLVMARQSETWLTPAKLIAEAQLGCDAGASFGPYISDLRKWFKRPDIAARMVELPAMRRNILKLIECRRARRDTRAAADTVYSLQIPPSRILWR
jgi:hypothetical protein